MKDKTTSAETQLLTCPFCGGKAVRGTFSVWCDRCKAETVSDTDATTEEIIARWNTRADLAINESQLRDELNVADDALETQVDRIAELRAERDSLARVNESLVAALRKFGGHLHTCDIHNDPRPPSGINKCDCGFAAALVTESK